MQIMKNLKFICNEQRPHPVNSLLLVENEIRRFMKMENIINDGGEKRMGGGWDIGTKLTLSLFSAL